MEPLLIHIAYLSREEQDRVVSAVESFLGLPVEYQDRLDYGEATNIEVWPGNRAYVGNLRSRWCRGYALDLSITYIEGKDLL